MSVVKKVHFIWLSRTGDKIPQYCAKFISEWKNLYSDFQVKLWTEQDIVSLEDKFLSLMWEDKKFDLAMVSVRMRFLIVYKHGGIYADIDTKPIKRVDSLLLDGTEFIAGKKYAFNTTDSNFFYAPAGHVILSDILTVFDVCTSNKTNKYIYEHPLSILYSYEYFQACELTPKSYSSHWPNRLGSWLSNSINRENVNL